MAEMTIGEVAKAVGLQTSAIRYYESVELLPMPKRVNGRRRYDESVFQSIAVIQIAQRAGFTIAEIKTLIEGFQPDISPGARWQVLAQEKLAELHTQILETQQMITMLQNGLECGCLQIEDCAIIQNGLPGSDEPHQTPL
jgi:MerR family redox-sensitive transcriptional activator SoxR